MKRIDPFGLRRRKRPVHERIFTDPGAPGAEMTLWLQPLDAPAVFLSGEHAQELIEQHITGYFDDEGYRIEPVPFPEVDGEAVAVSRSLLRTACRLEAMQAPAGPNGEPRDCAPYSAEEWVAISVTMPDAWADILAWSNAVQNGEQRERPNASGAATET